MVATKLRTVAPFVDAETISSEFATTKTLASGGATIPNNAGEIWVKPSAAMHWNPVGAATSSFIHEVRANEWAGPIPPRQHGTAQFIGDGGAITLVVIYMRGSRKDKHAVTRPY